MKLKLIRKFEPQKEDRHMSNSKDTKDEPWNEDDFIQHYYDENDNLKGGNNMSMELIKGNSSNLSDEELAEQARIKMGNLDLKGFPSLSNKTSLENGTETENEQEQEESNLLKDELQRKKEEKQLKKETKKRLDALNNAEEWQFNNVVEVCRNNELVKYQTVANIETLATLFDRQILSYNGELQRGYRTNKKGELIAVRSLKHINDIYESICKNRMHGGFITLNWNPEKGDINFDEEEHVISGSINQKLDILDGQHRLAAFSKILKAYRRNPNSVPNPADYQISVVIEMLDDDSAKSLFSEYATKSLKINKSRGEFLNVEDNTNKLCREIIKRSDIKVEVISTSIKSNSENIITFGVLSKNIKDNYAPKTKLEIEELSTYLTMFVDSLIQTFPKFMASKNLEERKMLREKSLTMEALAWSGYFKVSTFLQDKSKEEILETLSKFNQVVEYKGWKGNFLDKENPIFSKVMREGFKIINTSSSSTWINKVFVDYIVNSKSLDEIGAEG